MRPGGEQNGAVKADDRSVLLCSKARGRPATARLGGWPVPNGSGRAMASNLAALTVP